MSYMVTSPTVLSSSREQPKPQCIQAFWGSELLYTGHVWSGPLWLLFIVWMHVCVSVSLYACLNEWSPLWIPLDSFVQKTEPKLKNYSEMPKSTVDLYVWQGLGGKVLFQVQCLFPPQYLRIGSQSKRFLLPVITFYWRYHKRKKKKSHFV